MHRALLSLILLFAIAGCIHSGCVNEVREELSSPDGKQKIVIFTRDCGATTGSNTQASLLGREEKLPDKEGNMFIIDKAEAKVSWKQADQIIVVLERGARVFKKESSVGGITIEYRNEN